MVRFKDDNRTMTCLTFTEIPTAVPECSLIQYLEIGKSGLIQCSFNGSFSLVAWYNLDKMRSILLYHDGVKSGDGYESGEFDIHANGSLVIQSVTVEHEAVYSVTRAISSAVSAVSYDISVYTTVTPEATIPVIDQCPHTSGNVCTMSTLNQIEVTCTTRGSRPAIYLSWTKRTHERDFILPSNYMNFTNNNVTYTSIAKTKFFFEESSFLTLLVCQASRVPLNLMKEENILLVERQIDYTSILNPDKTYVKIHSRMELSCNDRVLNLITWKRLNGRQGDVETLFVSIFQPSNLTGMTYKDYKLEVDGSLSLHNTLVEHEGLYACLYDNGVSGGITLHNVFVIVDPTPVFPVVDGCNHQQYCVLEKEPRDVLTCSILGTIPMMKSDKCYSEKPERFMKQLKAKYEILYDSVQPIPYIKDRMYCVDKVFIDGGIDIMTGISEGKLLWDKLGSYQEVVKENCLKTKRQILEGEPGYGKSTLTLQLLYDWCKSLSTSQLKKVDVIIYLRLRQLGGVDSIFSAIRKFILPRDSDISEEDIKEILSQMTSVLVLLDGFDEYPDQESTETDIYHILKKNMFQDLMSF
ncbi:putative NLR family CARD domain-containing protein 4 [Apostichopus japonicus]|uniref:Putative NLR family CARD domain-containing protein 4 n=1 Tax=Stichopus japonicus TaxID=307972 RepID=A0A2G8K4H0_STIJA|nr:putative NLR family CARD domain-containing protein 4 [Apostichopus japonicus]